MVRSCKNWEPELSRILREKLMSELYEIYKYTSVTASAIVKSYNTIRQDFTLEVVPRETFVVVCCFVYQQPCQPKIVPGNFDST